MLTTTLLNVGSWIDTTFHGFDYAIFTFFSKLHADWLTPIIQVFTQFGDTYFVILLMVLGLALCLSKKTRKYGMALFLAIVIGTLLTNIVAKPLVARARPYVSLADDPFFMQWYTEAGKLVESDKSFPSGHTTAAFEIATSMFLVFGNKKIKWIFPVYAVLIGCSRLYLMVHYPTDVLGGVLVGIIAGVAGYFLMKAIMKYLESSNNKLIKKVNDIDLFAKKKPDKA